MEPVDITSRKKVFGWVPIDGTNIPYLVRNKERYVSVRMVEMKLLSRYPSTYPEELKTRPPLTSQYITQVEASLLTEINFQHCGSEYGQQPFTCHDLIVALKDFGEFYRIVKRNFPESAAKEAPSVEGGWVQVNNTLVPFIVRKSIKFVPLPVIKYGANLLNNVQVSGVESSEKEIDFLNRNCQEINLDFTFSRALTKLIELSLIPALSETRVVISELPGGDPYSHAKYLSEKEIEQPAPSYPAAMQNFGAPKSREPVSTQPSMQWMGPHMGIFHSTAPTQPQYVPPHSVQNTMEGSEDAEQKKQRVQDVSYAHGYFICMHVFYCRTPRLESSRR
jgi:hypothetical protein